MAKPQKNVKRKEAESVEVEPDAWERFQRTMDKVVPPKRRKSKDKETDSDGSAGD
jgi:hypothetical protein